MNLPAVYPPGATPTPISYAVPIRALEKMLAEFERHPEGAAPVDAPTFAERLCESRNGRRYEDGACRWDQTGGIVKILQPPNPAGPGQGESP